MAFSDLVKNLKDKAVTTYRNFFYEGKDAPPPSRGQENVYGGQEPLQQPQEQLWQQPYNQGAQQPVYGNYYQPYPNQAQQQPYGQPMQQPVYTAPQQPAQPERPFRFPRAARHAAEQPESNVVQVDFRGSLGSVNQPAPAAPVQEPAVSQSASLISARIINARSMSDCRTAITLLRNGDAVLIVMENITNPGDMRRLVDTLSGACYSLTATITKVSRYGVYLLAPQAMAVFADQATNLMNAGPTRGQPQGYQPGYSAQRPAYTAPQASQQPAVNTPYSQPAQAAAQPDPFTQRTAAPEAAAQNFYQRPAPQDGNIPSFTTRPTAPGFVPDEAEAANQ